MSSYWWGYSAERCWSAVMFDDAGEWFPVSPKFLDIALQGALRVCVTVWSGWVGQFCRICFQLFLERRISRVADIQSSASH